MAGMIKLMKNSSKSFGNRTRDIPVCTAVPHLTAPPRLPICSEGQSARDLKLTTYFHCSAEVKG
jgi:hypothetical protein